MNEHKLCCGTVADKQKLCAEIAERDSMIAHLHAELDKVCGEGRTPADAVKLREANHGLADEIDERDRVIAAQQRRIGELLAYIERMKWTTAAAELKQESK
jgi:hypothetical protein